ncbi:DUF4148 domain-containing protein [Burkholderia pseudomultivorans]|uniref:DUF4148 domain-containing protein n=1 Tax=Burkholderia pseudomultivorans TaxID=1207504 RepID=UPI00188E59F2|nr:DUF4148 domain-containing protein [Burkholderia pseudomultivorans]MBF5008659.1 DUF4148 domain-containing protein [Burkholderia pseudomultivorans]
MKHLILIKHSVFATLFLSAAVSAFAGGGGGSIGSGRNQYPHMNPESGSQSTAPTSVSADTPNPDGMTRAQVRAELLRAERAGFVSPSKNDYPPSATTIARNQARFQQVEQAWRGSEQTTASGQ